jgi:hypothetical protein
MNYNMICVILGIITGYLIMYVTSQIIIYHGLNSNDIKNKIFVKDGKKYRFMPRIEK